MSYCDEAFMVDSNGCFNCEEYCPKVKGRFGLAWVSESPDCPCPEPVGWQVEFLDTPSKVEQKCQEMVRWINCPPLPRCDPCPPVELCCNSNKGPAKQRCTCNNNNKQQNVVPQCCTCCNNSKPPRESRKKKCCTCGGQRQHQQQQRYPTSPCCNNRNRSPTRRRCGLPY